MRDIKIIWYKKDSNNQLSFKIICKEGDYSTSEDELIKQSQNNGDSVDINITWLSINNNIEWKRKESLQKLHSIICTYCDLTNNKVEEEIKKIYSKYWILSRKEMTDETIKNEYESYLLGCKENQ